MEIRRSSAEGVVCGILVRSIRIFRESSTLFPSLIIRSIFSLSLSVQKPHLLNHGNNYLRKILGRLNTSREQRFLEKLAIPLIAQKFCPIYAAQNFFAVFRNTISYPHSEPDQSSPCFPILFSEV